MEKTAPQPQSSPLSRTPMLQRKCACGGTPGPTGECEACRKKREQREGVLQRSAVNAAPVGEVPQIVYDVLKSPGQPLDSETRAFMEPRFGQDFSGVRVHTDARAAESAWEVNARAYTVGRDVVFGSGQHSPRTNVGQKLIAHELTHVVQQQNVPISRKIDDIQNSDDLAETQADNAANLVTSNIMPKVNSSTRMSLQRQAIPGDTAQIDMEMERKYSDKNAPKSQTCGRPAHCPVGFCEPYHNEELAKYYRAKNMPILMAGISLAVDSRVAPFWQDHLNGGSPPRDISNSFGIDFTNSPTTMKTTQMLIRSLKSKVESMPDITYAPKVFDISTLIPNELSAIGDSKSTDQMNFNVVRDIPGNLAGGIGEDQTTCPSGAQPSPFNDSRSATGNIIVRRGSETETEMIPNINYTVKDTVDLCPGDCGTSLEQIATVQISQFEATGISGDVPFTVNFQAPKMEPIVVHNKESNSKDDFQKSKSKTK